MRYVVDTSVIAKVFLTEPDRDRAVALLAAAARQTVELHVPSLLMYEINNVFVKRAVSGRAYDAAIRFLYAWLRSGVLHMHEVDEDLLRRAEAIASIDTMGQGYISSFDATFHALALRLGAHFVTSDQAYAAKSSKLVGQVEDLRALTL